VVASRLLPLACAVAAAATRRGAGIGLFLAVRHIARRPGGTRTTIVLAAAFALATFAIAAFTVDQRNVARVAAAQTGADAVLTVTAPAGQDLGTIVDRIDPGGTQAAAVDRYAGGADNGSVLLAVQPRRFARVALWLPGFADRPPASLGASLEPRTAPPVALPAGSGPCGSGSPARPGSHPGPSSPCGSSSEGRRTAARPRSASASCVRAGSRPRSPPAHARSPWSASTRPRSRPACARAA
jgi:hypothetical protein